MKRTFASEDERKNKLFECWITYLKGVHTKTNLEKFDEIYEGLAYISDLSKNRLGLHLDDGRKLRHIPISQEISELSVRLDAVYIILGKISDKWCPLDIISIGSTIELEPAQFHMTLNPLYSGAVVC